MNEPAPPRVLLRKNKLIDWNIFIAFLNEANIVDGNFTGDIHLSFNRGGVTGCKKIETIK